MLVFYSYHTDFTLPGRSIVNPNICENIELDIKVQVVYHKIPKELYKIISNSPFLNLILHNLYLTRQR